MNKRIGRTKHAWLDRRAAINRRKCFFEKMESRLTPSVFYDFTIIAETGSAGLTNIQPGASINDRGQVAFVANQAAGQSIFVGDGSTSPTLIGFTPASTRSYGPELQINDSGMVAAVDIDAGQRRARIWDSANPGSNAIIARSSTPRLDTSHFDGMGNFASMTNDGQLAFAGLENPPVANAFWEVHLSSSPVDRRDAFSLFSEAAELTLPPSPFFRQRAADGDKVLLANRQGGNTTITLYDLTGVDTSEELASTTGLYFDLGIRPGISDDGSVVVYAGNYLDGPGLFASVVDSTGSRNKLTLLGDSQLDPGPELGYEIAGGTPIFFDAFDYDQSVGVAVYQLPTGDPARFEPGESFVASFLGTPSQASPLNTVTNQPLFFSDQYGLWTIKVTLAPGIGGGAPEFNVSSAHPVVQLGDVIDGGTVTGITVSDPLTVANHLMVNSLATPTHPGDHYIAFLADTTNGKKLVRAAQIDSDGDGLYNHWEIDGINMDQVGAADLDLAAFGADPRHKDLFLEIDWLLDDAGRDFSPQAAAMDFLVAMFDSAPISNPDGVNGITLHIDAGPCEQGLTCTEPQLVHLSRNVGTGDLQGSDRVVEVGTGNHIHVAYFGSEGSVTFPGLVDSLGRPVVSHSMGYVKETYFGTKDKKARELAFHYILMADNLGMLDDMGAPTIVENSGQAELSWYRSSSEHTMPGNELLITLQGERDPVDLDVPASTMTIPTPVGYLQGQTLAHELGHNLGLRHGGIDSETSSPPGYPDYGAAVYNAKKPYRSLMNYAFQLDPDLMGNLVRDFSRSTDPVFDDWSNVQLDFARYFDSTGNSLGILSRKGAPPPAADAPEPSLEDFESVHGPLDGSPPVINALAQPSSVGIGQTLTVQITATDDVGVAEVLVQFDVNGDGLINGANENLAASPTGANMYQAVFSGIGGGAGLRSVTAYAIDVNQFIAATVVNVTVGGGAQADFDNNGVVDGADVLAWQRGLGAASGATKAQGDANGDGAVNSIDLAAWRSEFGMGGSAKSFSAAIVDESLPAERLALNMLLSDSPEKNPHRGADAVMRRPSLDVQSRAFALLQNHDGLWRRDGSFVVVTKEHRQERATAAVVDFLFDNFFEDLGAWQKASQS